MSTAAFIRNNVMGLIAIFIAIGGIAYANNEWTGANIVDGSLTTFDYRRRTDVARRDPEGARPRPQRLPSNECAKFIVCYSSTKIADNAVGASEISAAVGTSEAAPNSLTGSDVRDDSLTSSDIDESTLSPVAAPGPRELHRLQRRHRADLHRLLHPEAR